MNFDEALSTILTTIEREPHKSIMVKDRIDLLDPVRSLFFIIINGVEITQAIQYRQSEKHLTDPADRGADNSVRLVADKPAYVRVYVEASMHDVANVTGTVTMQVMRYGIWVDAAPLMQQAPFSITAAKDPVYARERSSLSRSLNFIIPASRMAGHFRLRIHVEVKGDKRYSAEEEGIVDASLKQTLRLRGIPVRYLGPDASGSLIDLSAPRLADFQSTLATTLQMFPVSQTPEISLAGVFTFSEPLTGAIANGNCPSSWNNLLFWLGIAKAVDGNRSNMVYYGLLPNGIPRGGAAGCGGGGGTAAGFIDDGITMAHEIGHYFNFAHAPACLPADDNKFDVNYPVYEPYETMSMRTASIGEYGLDSTGTIYSPVSSSDIMSYCSFRWISLYHYLQLLDNPLLNPQIVRGAGTGVPSYYDDRFRDPHRIPDPTPPWESRYVFPQEEVARQNYVVLTGFIKYGEVEIASVLKADTRLNNSGRKLEGFMAEILDANSRVLHRTLLRHLETHAGCGCGCHGEDHDEPEGVVQAMLPSHDEAYTYRIRKDENVLWSKQAPDTYPEVNDVQAHVEGDEMIVSWRTDYPGELSLERIVMFAPPNSEEWTMLAINLTEDSARITAKTLPGGDLQIKVLVTDGFHSASGKTMISLPEGELSAAILWPGEGSVVRTGGAVRFWGTATRASGEPLPAEALRWEIDGVFAGEGPELWHDLPEIDSEHRLTLKVKWNEKESETSVIFLATCCGQKPYLFKRS